MDTRLVAGVGIIFALTFAGSARAELIDNGDGTITDTNSNLMWLKYANLNAGALDHAAARAWIENLNRTGQAAGYSDWRLPSGTDPDNSVCNSTPPAPVTPQCLKTEFASLYHARSIQAWGGHAPFVGIVGGGALYWTSTDFPPDPTQVMAQDFDNGGQVPKAKTGLAFVWPVRVAGPVSRAAFPFLYGVVSSGPNAGTLLEIDTQNGVTKFVKQTGFPSACGLTYDRIASRLILSPCFGTDALQIIDPGPGNAVALGPTGHGMRSIARRHADTFIYAIDASPSLIRASAGTAGNRQTVGIINKASTGGLAERPSDGKLFGIGMTNPMGTQPSTQQLFTLNPEPGGGAHDTDIGLVAAANMRALTFHPDGRLFATNVSLLHTLNPASGAAIGQARSLSGPSAGPLGGLAVTGLPLRAGVDAWIKDCDEDIGNVASSPTPCAQWWRSPDIRVNNDTDDFEEMPVQGANTVKVRIRNRGMAPAPGTRARLFAYVTQDPSTWPASKTLVGTRTLDVAADATAIATFEWRPSLLVFRNGSTYCLAVELTHAQNAPMANATPPQDNNLAVRCSTYRLVAVPVPGPIPRPVP